MSNWAKIESVLRGHIFKMLSDELGIQLHDRETTGESLTTQEKEQLEAWYVQQDAAETAMLKAAQIPLPNLVFIQDRIDAAISHSPLAFSDSSSLPKKINQNMCVNALVY
jgi:hypothetical protein